MNRATAQYGQENLIVLTHRFFGFMNLCVNTENKKWFLAVLENNVANICNTICQRIMFQLIKLLVDTITSKRIKTRLFEKNIVTELQLSTQNFVSIQFSTYLPTNTINQKICNNCQLMLLIVLKQYLIDKCVPEAIQVVKNSIPLEEMSQNHNSNVNSIVLNDNDINRFFG